VEAVFKGKSMEAYFISRGSGNTGEELGRGMEKGAPPEKNLRPKGTSDVKQRKRHTSCEREISG